MCLRQRLVSKNKVGDEIKLPINNVNYGGKNERCDIEASRSGSFEERVNEERGDVDTSLGNYHVNDGHRGHWRRRRHRGSLYARFWRKMSGRVLDFIAGAVFGVCLVLLVLFHHKEAVDDVIVPSTQEEGAAIDNLIVPSTMDGVGIVKYSTGMALDEEATTKQSTQLHIDQSMPKPNTDQLSGEYGKFLMPELKPGQAETLKWEDGSVVQEYATRVGLPSQLVPTLIEYAKEMGLYDIMTNFLYDDPIEPGETELFSFQSPYQKGAKESEMRNFTWNVERPAKKWHSDAHWFNTADELSHEDALRALARGGFDEVLKGIGEKYDLDTLHVDGIGFMAITHCDAGYLHTDFRNVGGGGYNVLFEISSPEDTGPELFVEGDNKIKGEIKYTKDVGWVNGDGTRHGAAMCDHRAQRGVRITATVFLVDLTRENRGGLYDTSSIFPPREQQAKWMWAQRGRHWRKGGGHGLKFDQGRAAFEVEDSAEGCKKEDCLNISGKLSRKSCLKTCKVFMDDSGEYKPGTDRWELFGY